MTTIALVLQDPAARRVREVWSQLEIRFGLKGPRKVPFPHITLLGFEGLTHPQVKEVLKKASHTVAPLALETCGLGVFLAPARIIHAPVVVTPPLARLHNLLFEELEWVGAAIAPLYLPEAWCPHLTLAQGDPVRGSYGEAMDCLLQEELRLTFEVRNLTLFDWIGPRYEPCDRFPLMGKRET